MPALRSCGHKRWTVSSDDFVGPTQAAVILRSFVLILLFADLMTLFKAPEGCPVLHIPFLLSFLLPCVMQVVVLINEVALLVMSLRGTIMYTKPRRHITKLLYIRIFVFFVELGVMIYASNAIFNLRPSTRSCIKTTVKFLEVIIILLWIIITFYMIGFLIFSDPLGCFSNSLREGFNEAMAFDSSTLLRPQKNMHHAKRLVRDKSLHRNRVEVKRASQKIRRICKLCHLGGSKAGAFDDLSRLIFKLFGNVDLVPSDILAAIVLMAREQNTQLARGECIVGPLREYTMKHLSSSMKGENYEYKPPVDFDFTVKDNRVIMLELLYYMDYYAFSAYGWPQHVYANLCCGLCQLARSTCCKCHYRCNDPDVENGDLLNDSLCLCGRATIDLHYNIPHSQFVYATYENGMYEAPFYVSIDNLKRTVVVTIRGTLSISDILTDVNSVMVSMDIPRLGLGYVHKGLYKTANWLVRKLEERHILEKAFENNEEYRLVITGHSLGAGVASVVATMLRPSYPDLVCYCFSPQGCAMSYNLAQYTKKFIYSFVLGDDVVGRFNWRSFVYIRKKILLLLKNCKQHKVQVLCHRNCGCGGQVREDNCEAPFEELCDKNSDDIEQGFTTVATNSIPRWKRAFVRPTICEKVDFETGLHQTELMSTIPAFIPGNVINLRIRRSRAPWFLRSCFPNHVESVKERANEDMCALRITAHALDDHLPENVLKGLRMIVEECIYPEYPERLNQLHKLPIKDNTHGQYALEEVVDGLVEENKIKVEIEESLPGSLHPN